MATILEDFAVALEHHRAGRLREAETIYRQILETDPGHPDAWRLLGLIACQLGDYQAGVEFIQRAVALDPYWPEATVQPRKRLEGPGKARPGHRVLSAGGAIET